MRNVIFLLLIFGLFGCFGHNPSIKTGLEGKSLPSFQLLLMDSVTRYSTSNIPDGSPIVLFYFSPQCPYCKALTDEVTNNMKSLSGIRFYMVSNFPFDMIKSYYEHYSLNQYSNIVVGQDFDLYFSNYFQANGVPYLAIYGRDRRLKQALMGKISANVIKDIAFK